MGLPNCLFPRLPIVYTQQLEILVLTLSATNYYSYLKEYKKILKQEIIFKDVLCTDNCALAPTRVIAFVFIN